MPTLPTLRRLCAAALAAVLSIGIPAAIVAPVHATFAGDNGRLAFASDRDGSMRIYTSAPDGSDIQPLDTGGVVAAEPDWSPDGERLAFSSMDGNDGGIWVVNRDGSDLTRITWQADDRRPSWSPDGTQIAFIRAGWAGEGVLNEGGLAIVTKVAAPISWFTLGPASVTSQDWEDASRVKGTRSSGYFSSCTNESCTVGNATGGSLAGGLDGDLYHRLDDSFDIWTVGGTRITTDPAADTEAVRSPDELLIAFQSDRGGDPGIWMMNSDGGGAHQVLGGDGFSYYTPDWQPWDTTSPDAEFVQPPPVSATPVIPLTVVADDRSGVATMRLANNNATSGGLLSFGVDYALGGSPRIRFTVPGGWDLTAPGTGGTNDDGQKHVYAQFLDTYGNWSSPLTVSVTLDRVAPTGSAELDRSDEWLPGPMVAVLQTGSDATSGLAYGLVSSSSALTNGVLANPDSFMPNNPVLVFNVTNPATGGSYTEQPRAIYIQWRDVAGNVSPVTTLPYKVDLFAPSGTISVAGGAVSTTSATVSVAVQGSDSASGLATTELSNDGAAWTVVSPGSAVPWSLTDPGTGGSDGDGTRQVCARWIDHMNFRSTACDSILLDHLGPEGTVTIAGGAGAVSTANVTLSVAATDAGTSVTHIRLSNDGTTWIERSYNASQSWSLTDPAAGGTPADGTKTVYVQWRDASGNWSPTSVDTVLLDRLGPSGTVAIAGGASAVNTPDVTLSVPATAAGTSVTHVRLSNDGSTWIERGYGVSQWWTLTDPAAGGTPADGTKTVHVQWRDGNGNWSPASTATVVLDRVGPSGTLTLAGGATATSATSIDVATPATDDLTAVVTLALSSNGSTWISSAYQASGTWSLVDAAAGSSSADGGKVVYAKWRDAAGNWSVPVTRAITLDRVKPTATISIAGGAALVNTPTVTIAAGGSDDATGLGSLRLSNDGATWTTSAYATSVPWSLVDGAGGTSADGSKTVHLAVRDGAGNWSNPVSANVILDRTPPAGSIDLPGSATTSATITLGVTAGDALSGPSQVQVSNNGTSWATFAYAPSVAWSLTDPAYGGTSQDGAKTVQVRWRDIAGNWSGVSTASIVLDRAAPVATAPVSAPVSGAVLSGSKVVASVSWSATDGTGSDIGSYEVARSADGGATWAAVTTAAAATSARVTLSTSGTTRFRVRAIDSAGNRGNWANGPTLTPRLVQNSSTSLRYTRTWTTTRSSSYSGGSARYAKGAGASVSYTTTARSIAFVTTRAPSRGKVKVYVDGSYVTTLNLAASSTTYRYVAWLKTWPTASTHTVRLVVAGTSGHPRVDVDAFVAIR